MVNKEYQKLKSKGVYDRGDYSVICNKCQRPIIHGSRMYYSKRGNPYHVSCGSHLKDKNIEWA